jgi:predicted DNA binding CopG/RHH family protein
MSSFGKSLVELVQGTINAGIKVPFTEEELKDMGVKIPKSKLSLAKKTRAAKYHSFQLPEQLVKNLKRKAIQVHKPYKTFIYEVLSRASV